MILGLTSDQLGYMMKGVGWTVTLSILGLAGGSLLALPIALGRLRRRGILRLVASAFMYAVQSIPLPVLMFVVYFGISIGGFSVPVLAAAAAALAINAAAFLGDIWYGAIRSVPSVQWEASDALALTPAQTMAYVILPQAFRISIPPTVGFFVALIKNTSYAVVIGAPELTYSSRVINNTTFEPFVIFSLSAVLYFAICYPLSFLSFRLERARARG